MKLFFDCRFIRVDHHDGISRFSAELASALARKAPLVALVSSKEQLKWLPEGIDFILGNDPTHAIAELLLPSKLNRAGATHVFSPMQTMGSFGRKYKLVLTLHDLIYYSHPKAPTFLPLHIRIAWRLYHLSYLPVRVLLNRADSVVTVSETSKALIVCKKLTKRAIHVIYNAPDTAEEVALPVVSDTSEKRRRLVYMGSFMEYKNVECLISAMQFLPEYQLVLLSKVSEKRREQLQALANTWSDRITFKNGVSDAEYAKELSGAFACVSASKDEGFGIPLVEAMRHGAPIVVSDIPIFREIAAEAGSYFDPSSPEDFANQIQKLEPLDVWEDASNRSKERQAAFSWDASATKLLAVLENL
jgi:glycosyltransferase involved in cell wall biosynthesis